MCFLEDILVLETSAFPWLLFIPLHPQSLHTDGDVNLSHPWGYLGKMQDPRRSSTPTMMVGMTEAWGTRKSACGKRRPEDDGPED